MASIAVVGGIWPDAWLSPARKHTQQQSLAIGKVIDNLFSLDKLENLINVDVCKVEILSNALS